MNPVIRILNFMLGLIAVMLILLGATSSEANRTQMIALGIGLFILAFMIHMINQMMGQPSR